MENQKNRILNTAVIMAGGQGTRLKKITGKLPKSMVNIHGTGMSYNGQAKDTILEDQIKIFSENGINNIIFVVGNKKEYIENAFTNEIVNHLVYTNIPGDRHINISFYEEQYPLGTAGSFCDDKFKEMLNGATDFVFSYADTLFDMDLQKMYEFHKQNKADVTLPVQPSKYPDDRVLYIRNKNEQIVKMIPKQEKGEGNREGFFQNLTSSGPYIISTNTFNILPTNAQPLDIVLDFFYPLIKSDSYKLLSYNTPCYIKDLGVVRRYFEGVEDLSKNLPMHMNPSKTPQTCVLFRENDVIQHENGNFVLNEIADYSISKLNENGIITGIIRNSNMIMNNSLQDSIIDTILCRQGENSFVNFKISSLQELSEYTQNWNIDLQNSFALKQTEEGCSGINLAENCQQNYANLFDATMQIISNRQAQMQQDENSLSKVPDNQNIITELNQ